MYAERLPCRMVPLPELPFLYLQPAHGVPHELSRTGLLEVDRGGKGDATSSASYFSPVRRSVTVTANVIASVRDLARSETMTMVMRRASRSDCDRMVWPSTGVEPAPEMLRKRPGHIAPRCARICDGYGTVL